MISASDLKPGDIFRIVGDPVSIYHMVSHLTPFSYVHNLSLNKYIFIRNECAVNTIGVMAKAF